eukprot:5679187-Alexandrium_andersonii.AAC.1
MEHPQSDRATPPSPRPAAAAGPHTRQPTARPAQRGRHQGPREKDPAQAPWRARSAGPSRPRVAARPGQAAEAAPHPEA